MAPRWLQIYELDEKKGDKIYTTDKMRIHVAKILNVLLFNAKNFYSQLDYTKTVDLIRVKVEDAAKGKEESCKIN